MGEAMDEKTVAGGDRVHDDQAYKQKDAGEKSESQPVSPYDGGSSSEHGGDDEGAKEDSPGLGAYFVRSSTFI